MLQSKARPLSPTLRRHSPTPPKAQPPPPKKAKDELQAKEELLEAKEELLEGLEELGLSEQRGQPASSASGPAEPAGGPAEPAGGGSEPASSGSWTRTHLSSRMQEWADDSEAAEHTDAGFDEYGYRARRDVSNMVPVQTTLYRDPNDGRYYNARGNWVDELGRPKPHRGTPGKFRSRGKNYPNRNPAGPGANPPHLHSRFGERCHLEPAAQGPLAAAQGPPAAAHRRSADTVMEEQDPSPRGEHRARPGQRGDAQGQTRPASHRRSAWERGEQRARPRRPDSRGSPAAAQGSRRPDSRGSPAAAQGSRAYSRGPSSRGGQGWRAYSTGPSSTDPSSRRGWRGRANRNDWHKYSSRSRDTIRDGDRR